MSLEKGAFAYFSHAMMTRDRLAVTCAPHSPSYSLERNAAHGCEVSWTPVCLIRSWQWGPWNYKVQ